jgi:hypothetical protein
LDESQRKLASGSISPEEAEEQLGAIQFRYPFGETEIYGYTASLDYVNDATNKIIHHAELTRPKEELVSALFEFADVIPNERQRSVYKEALKSYMRRRKHDI